MENNSGVVQAVRGYKRGVMDLAALILAIVALVLFLVRPVQLGLAFLTAALICQFVALTGDQITAR